MKEKHQLCTTIVWCFFKKNNKIIFVVLNATLFLPTFLVSYVYSPIQNFVHVLMHTTGHASSRLNAFKPTELYGLKCTLVTVVTELFCSRWGLHSSPWMLTCTLQRMHQLPDWKWRKRPFSVRKALVPIRFSALAKNVWIRTMIHFLSDIYTAYEWQCIGEGKTNF